VWGWTYLPSPVAAGMVREVAEIFVETYLQLIFQQPLVEPGTAEHQLAQPVDETFVLVHEGFVTELHEVLSEGAHGVVEGAGGDQLHEVGALVVVERTRIYEVELHRGRLDPLCEIHVVESEAEASELEDVILT